MDARKPVSVEVAQRLGITRQNLMMYLARHPDLRPQERLPNGDFLWSEAEIQAVIERRPKGTRKRRHRN